MASSGAGLARPRIGIAAEAIADLGTLPRAAVGMRGSARLRWRHWLVALYGSYLPPVQGLVAAADSRGGEVDAWSIGAAGCGVPWTRRGVVGAAGDLALRLCVGGGLGEMRAVGFGVTVPREGAALWGALHGGVGFDVWLTPALAFVSEVELGVPLTRPNFFLSNVGDVHAAASVRGRLAAGLEVTF